MRALQVTNIGQAPQQVSVATPEPGAGEVQVRIAAKPDLTIDELTAELFAEHGLKVHRSSVGRLLHRLGLSHKKRPACA